jgi:CheY-like chemotaxis protein
VGHQWRFDKSSIEGWLQKSTAKAKILVIDDEPIIRLLFKETLKGLGHQVATAETGARGLQLVKEQDFGLVFLDLKMPGMDGAEVFRRIKALRPDLPVTIITGHPDGDLMARALAEGPFGVMNKPFSVSDITTAVQTFLGVTQKEG